MPRRTRGDFTPATPVRTGVVLVSALSSAGAHRRRGLSQVKASGTGTRTGRGDLPCAEGPCVCGARRTTSRFVARRTAGKGSALRSATYATRSLPGQRRSCPPGTGPETSISGRSGEPQSSESDAIFRTPQARERTLVSTPADHSTPGRPTGVCADKFDCFSTKEES